MRVRQRVGRGHPGSEDQQKGRMSDIGAVLPVGPWWVRTSMFVGMWQMVALLVSMDFISIDSPIFFLFNIQNLLWMARK